MGGRREREKPSRTHPAHGCPARGTSSLGEDDALAGQAGTESFHWAFLAGAQSKSHGLQVARLTMSLFLYPTPRPLLGASAGRGEAMCNQHSLPNQAGAPHHFFFPHHHARKGARVVLRSRPRASPQSCVTPHTHTQTPQIQTPHVRLSLISHQAVPSLITLLGGYTRFPFPLLNLAASH